LKRVEIVEASHPTPDLSSVHATRQLLALLCTTTDTDTVFFVLSGGASALLFAPARGLSYEAKAVAVRLLVDSGAPIEDINVVRRHLSAVKGGRLRVQARCAKFCTLAISDVIGDDPATIGSGPTVADASTFGDALEVVERHELRSKLPAAAVAYLQRGAEGLGEETPKQGVATFKDDVYQIVASNRVALATCMEAAGKLGYPAEIISESMAGNTHVAARRFASTLAAAAMGMQGSSLPRLFFAGGETTLSVSQGGKGGRNQEFALVAAAELQSIPNVVLLSAGTDGTDGPTDAAGAFADGTTVERACALGFDPREHLRRHDVYPLLEALGDLHRTGPTGTNVMDLVIGLAF
jgi:hydroxypyruvate reductase